VNYPTLTYTVPPPTFNASCSDLTLTYSSYTSGTSSLPAFVSFDNTTLIYTISTSDYTMIGNYTIVFEYCNNIDTCYYPTFIIAIMRSPCETATISASTLTDQSYTVTQTADNYIFTAFTSNVTWCLI
jgi:hypothetical protein